MAQRRLPGFVFEYLDGGAEEETTLQRNRAVFDEHALVPRVLVDVSERDHATTMFGIKSALPVALAPTGFNGLLWKHGDIALARAARDMEIPFTISTVSSDSIDEIAHAAGGRLWFQLYPLKNHEFFSRLIERAHSAGCEALLVTLDAPVAASRPWDARNYSAPFQLTLRAKLDVLLHPRWMAGVLLPRGLPKFGNFKEFLPAGQTSPLDVVRFMGTQFNPAFDWEALARLRDRWSRKLLLKGVLSPADAAQALRLGVDGIVLSNHGGRQLDGAITPLEALEEIAPVVGTKIPLIVDSGFRRGSDVIKALALGANMVLLGRATLYGLAAGGEAGVRHALDIFRKEIERNLALMGCPSIAALDSSYLRKKSSQP